MLEDHTIHGRCLGQPVMYSTATGKLYYRVGYGNGLGMGSLYIRKPNFINALIGLDASVHCFKMIAIDERVKEYTLEELPIDYNGVIPRYELRDFIPLLPPLPTGVDLEVRHNDPKNLTELEVLLNDGVLVEAAEIAGMYPESAIPSYS